MKKSNIILIVLAVCLFVTPLVVWGIYSLKATDELYTGFQDEQMILDINDPALTKADVVINTEKASGFPGNELLSINKSSYLYYEGSRKYLPDLNLNGNRLSIKPPADAPSNEKLTLHVRINGIYQIVLNGETIWEREGE